MRRLMKKWALPLIIFMMAGAGLGIWSVFVEPSRIIFPEHSIHLKNWPRELSGYSIAFLSDTHVGSPHLDLEKMQQIVEQTNALRPDLILLGGDYVIHGVVAGKKVHFQDIVAVLAGLQARDGVFAVLGNHDWWENGPGIKAALEARGVPVLDDEARYLENGTKGFWLGGVSDYWESAHDVPKTLASVPEDQPVILFSHSPDIFPDVPSRVLLTIAGHTHGGQVYVPLLGRPVVPSKFGQRYVRGLIREGEKQLFVGSGLGTSIFPIRFLTPPEVPILKLYPLEN